MPAKILNRPNFSKIIIGHLYGDTLVGLTGSDFYCFLCGFYRDRTKAEEKEVEFYKWMRGQTTGVTDDGSNRVVYYIHDVIRFMEGLPITD